MRWIFSIGKIKREWNQAYRRMARTVFQQGPLTAKADSRGNLFCPQKSGACQIHSTCSFYLRARQAFVFRHKWNFDGTYSPVLLSVSPIVLDRRCLLLCSASRTHTHRHTQTHASYVIERWSRGRLYYDIIRQQVHIKLSFFSENREKWILRAWVNCPSTLQSWRCNWDRRRGRKD